MPARHAIAIISLLATPVFAQDTITVTAGRTTSPPPSATTLDRHNIGAIDSPSLTDTLARVAGVRAFRKGGLGGSTYLALRGGEPNFTAVLVEGALVTDPTNTQGGGFDLSQLSPHLVERIAIVPGALSAVHGAEALSGIVDIRLRGPDGILSGGVSADFDTDGGSDLAGSVSVPVGTGGILLGANRYERFSESQQSGLEREQFIGRYTGMAGPVSVGATALHSDYERSGFPEDSGGVELAANREREQREGSLTLLAVDASIAQGPLRPEVRGSWSQTKSDVETPAIFPGALDPVPAIVSDTVFDRYQVEGAMTWTANDRFSVAAGAEFVRETAESSGTIDVGVPLPTAFDISRERLGAFTEATLVPSDGLRLTGSVRLDDPQDLSAEWTVRAAAEWTILPNGPVLFGSYAEGYRLPSLFALAYPLLANPDLKPERSQSLTAGVSQPLGQAGRVTLSLFDSRYTDLIDFDPERFTNVNRARVDSRGMEAKTDVRFGAWSLAGQLSYLDIDVPAGSPPLRSRPEWQGSLSLSHGWQSGARAHIVFLGVDSSFDSSIPTGMTQLDGFVTIDIAAELPVTEGVTVRAKVRNLLDKDYQESVGVPALGTTASVGMALSF